MNSVGSKSMSLKYQKSSPSGCKDIRIRTFMWLRLNSFISLYFRYDKVFKSKEEARFSTLNFFFFLKNKIVIFNGYFGFLKLKTICVMLIHKWEKLSNFSERFQILILKRKILFFSTFCYTALLYQNVKWGSLFVCIPDHNSWTSWQICLKLFWVIR